MASKIFENDRPRKLYRNKTDAVDEDGSRCAYIPKFKNPEQYVNTKIKMLTDDFCITLTDEDIAYLRSFKTECSINGAFRAIINKYWK